ncbi:Uncharacterised protein [Mycobacteroides abscessus subsp. abscessus]|nr:Uncharacterised protein [Mycobacteroides abscessus subsp. abscessus]SLE42667.1 Uncharacterised protein [Mycobacteroides abscessus subsp. abscessus]
MLRELANTAVKTLRRARLPIWGLTGVPRGFNAQKLL